MKAEFEIDMNIYDLEKIQQSLDDFVEVADITFSWNILKIESDEEGTQEIFGEFMNYVLWL